MVHLRKSKDPPTHTFAQLAHLAKATNNEGGEQGNAAQTQTRTSAGKTQIKLLYNTLVTIRTIKPIFPRSFQTCVPLANKLRLTAIQHVCTELIKSLMLVKLKKFVDARNRMDIPDGLFGISLNNFYLRRKRDTLYMDVLNMVNKDILQLAKYCILLDEVQEFLQRIVSGFNSHDMSKVLQDIKDSQYLLNIEDVIRAEYKTNNEELQHLRFKLRSFSKYEREMTDKLNSAVYDALNECVDSELVKTPIEYRYQLQFQKCGLKQFQLKLENTEERCKEQLRQLNSNKEREMLTSGYSRAKYKSDIDSFKNQLDMMTKRYDVDSERLDGEITYLRNSLELIETQWIDYRKLLDRYSQEMVPLKQWNEEKLEAERKKLQAEMLKEERRKKKEEEEEKRRIEKEISAMKSAKKK